MKFAKGDIFKDIQIFFGLKGGKNVILLPQSKVLFY